MAARLELSTMATDSETFGPTRERLVTSEIAEMIYAPYNHTDKFGRVSDWLAEDERDGRGNRGETREKRERRERKEERAKDKAAANGGAGVETVFNFVADVVEEESFSLVDNATTRGSGRRDGGGGGRGGGRWNQFGGRGRGRGMTEEFARDLGVGAERERNRQARIQSRKAAQWNTWAYNRQQQQVHYSASVDIRPDWEVVEQIHFPEIIKQSHVLEDAQPEDLASYGSVRWFDKSYDRVTPKTEVPLRRRTDEPPRNLTASDDPIIQKYSESGAGNVFTTDNVLAAIMCAARSNYSWDILIRKKDGKMFLDKRNDGNFDLLTVSETAQEAITDDPDDMNGVPQLSQEGTKVNRAFVEQSLNSEKDAVKVGEPVPFFNEVETDSVAYKYRKWNVDEKTQLVCRCEYNGVSESKGMDKGKALTTLVKALNEFDSKVTGIDWRLKIETQRGAVIANELKNNANKLAKWTAMAMLVDAELIKLGFVSRTHPRDPNLHVVLNTQTYKTKDFAQQINLKESSMWGSLKLFLETCRKFEDGNYLCVKDPSKATLRFYKYEEKASVF
ncbi:putative eukaryotic translation initiation factor [Ostreococcus tauri]|uniref:Putative eukaryotic translation initiation factor n=1 Tax=Ostreococcus tauri TaxID=70448 RepID=A0A1Y5IB35_OSTTA|nr:putative eukaryotic translation initiation factor [Ostreococcus tauri]